MPLPRDFQSSKHSRNFVLLTMNVAFMKYVENTSSPKDLARVMKYFIPSLIYHCVRSYLLWRVCHLFLCFSLPNLRPHSCISYFTPRLLKEKKVVFISIKEAPSLCSDFTVRKPLSCEKNSYSLVSAVSKEIRRCAGASARELLDELMRGIQTEFRKDNGKKDDGWAFDNDNPSLRNPVVPVVHSSFRLGWFGFGVWILSLPFPER